MRSLFWNNPWLAADWITYNDIREARCLELQNQVEQLKAELDGYKEVEAKVKEDVKEEKEDIKEYANTITTTVEGFLGCPIGSVFTFNEELGIWEHNWSNENVTRNVSFSANLFDRNSKFFKILSWGE